MSQFPGRAQLGEPSKFTAEVADITIVTNQAMAGKLLPRKNLIAAFAAVGYSLQQLFQSPRLRPRSVCDRLLVVVGDLGVQ